MKKQKQNRQAQNDQSNNKKKNEKKNKKLIDRSKQPSPLAQP